MQIGSWQFSDSDLDYVTASLGRPPQAVVGVAARDYEGRPRVIINLPMQRADDEWTPFPTLYWLVDPVLCNAVSEAERQGAIAEIEQAIADDEELMRSHLEDNRFYARARWAVLNAEEERIAEKLGYREMLETSGVGGVANHASVKCLHAHYAFHLARQETGTTVGRLMKQRFGIRSDL